MLCPHRSYVFCIYLRTKSVLYHLQNKMMGFYKRNEKYFLRGTDWVFKNKAVRASSLKCLLNTLLAVNTFLFHDCERSVPDSTQCPLLHTHTTNPVSVGLRFTTARNTTSVQYCQTFVERMASVKCNRIRQHKAESDGAVHEKSCSSFRC
jgi:hypothetical protein